MSGVRVVGLDLSLRSTGMSDGRETKVFRTDETMPIEQRFYRIVDECCRFVNGRPIGRPSDRRASLVVIEGSAFGAKGSAREQLAALRFMVRTELWFAGIPLAVVSPSRLKAYTTGDGKADKTAMVRSVLDRHKQDFTLVYAKDGRYDMADAFALAAMGYQHLGHPLPTFESLSDDPNLFVHDWTTELRGDS